MSKPRRLFVDTLPEAGGRLLLPPESVRHAQVLRLCAGETVCLFDGRGHEAQARLIRAERERFECEASPARLVPEPSARVTLILGVPKAAKLELIVRMATELGVHAIGFAHTERSVPKLSENSPKLERLRRVAREACAQSGQGRAPELFGPGALLQMAARAPEPARKLVFWEEESERGLHTAFGIGDGSAESREVWAVVGPEGGLARDEVGELASSGYLTVSLGPGLLRVDTAAVVVSALLLDRVRALPV